MPAAVMQLTVLVFAVGLCKAGSEVKTMNSTNHTSSSNGTSIQTTTSTPQNTITVPTDSISFSSQTPATASTPSQTNNWTEETSHRPPAQSTTAIFTFTQTVSSRPTVQTTTNVAESTTVKATSAALSDDVEKGEPAANPGLVAVICIFCIIFALVLVVALFKCTKSSRSNFQRLEDVPMGKVSENSPFAKHSK